MTQIITLIFRFTGIVFGYFAACLTAAGIFAFMSALVTLQDFDTYNDFEVYIALFLNIMVLTLQFARAALIPVFVIIFIYEIRSTKDWLYYILAAGLVAIHILFSPFVSEATQQHTLSYIVSAMGGGFIYWLFIGIRAGNWRRTI